MAKALLILVGVILVCTSGGLGVATRKFVARASGAEGTVVRLNAGGSHPQIEFTSDSGQHVSYPQGGFIRGYEVGDRVRVIYDPADPVGTARITVFGALWFVPILLLGLGLAFLISGLLTKTPVSNSVVPRI